MDTIHIAYALDDKFAELTGVSITSVLCNTDRSIIFHLFVNGVSQANVDKLRAAVKKSANAECILISKDLDGGIFLASDVVPKETYIEGLLPDLLPELSRVIWLDGDVMIEGDISELWEIDLGDNAVAMSPDYPLEDLLLRKAILGIDKDEIYYNTGVALLDLDKLRQCNFTEKIIENIERLNYAITGAGINWYRVQDVMNCVLHNKVKRLPVKYNSFFWQSLPITEPLSNCVEEIMNPYTIHLIANPKPNKLGVAPINSADWERYYHYKALSPFALNCDAENVARYKQRENNTMNGFMMYDRLWFTRYFAPRFFKRAADVCSGVVSEREIAVWGMNDLTWNLIPYLSARGVNVKHVVDGLPDKQGAKIFEGVVESPDILKNSANDMFVLLDMRGIEVPGPVASVLRDWNYTNQDYYHVYNTIPVGDNA
jgi:lipopolysaccharide biosynthesis glycosyltransferase